MPITVYQCYDTSFRGYDGIQVNTDECELTLATAVKENLVDLEEKQLFQGDLEEVKGAIEQTGFNAPEELLIDIQALNNPEPEDTRSWRIGESIAEIILDEDYGARFYWNELRDARNPQGNKTGADLVGFIETNGEVLFLFGEDLLLLELVNVAEAKNNGNGSISSSSSKSKQEYKTVSEYLNSANQELTDLYLALRDYLMNLGDDVQEKTLKYYFAYKRIKNFACVEVFAQSQKIHVYVKLNPDEVQLEDGFTRDVRNIGHYGTGDLEITIRTEEDLTKAEPLILRSYEVS